MRTWGVRQAQFFFNHSILSTIFCIFLGGGTTERMGRLCTQNFPREDWWFWFWRCLHFWWSSWSREYVFCMRSSICFVVFYVNVFGDHIQPSSHGRPAMGACSNQVVCHGILSHRKEHHYKKSFGIEQSKQIWGCDPKSWYQQHSDKSHSPRHHWAATIIRHSAKEGTL